MYFLLSSCCNKCHPTTKQRYTRVGCTVECTLFTKAEVSQEKALEMTFSSSQAFQDLLSNYNIVEQND